MMNKSDILDLVRAYEQTAKNGEEQYQSRPYTRSYKQYAAQRKMMEEIVEHIENDTLPNWMDKDDESE